MSAEIKKKNYTRMLATWKEHFSASLNKFLEINEVISSFFLQNISAFGIVYSLHRKREKWNEDEIKSPHFLYTHTK